MCYSSNTKSKIELNASLVFDAKWWCFKEHGCVPQGNSLGVFLKEVSFLEEHNHIHKEMLVFFKEFLFPRTNVLTYPLSFWLCSLGKSNLLGET
jgi:hypothetical protein